MRIEKRGLRIADCGLRRFAAALLLVWAVPVFAVDLNAASRAELEQLNGLGVSTAARVLEERARAPFADWADFTRRVKGFRASRVEQLRQQGVTINGQPAPVDQK